MVETAWFDQGIVPEQVHSCPELVGDQMLGCWRGKSPRWSKVTSGGRLAAHSCDGKMEIIQ